MLYVLSHRKPKTLCLARFIAYSVPKWNISFCNSLVSYIILAAQVGPEGPTSCISSELYKIGHPYRNSPTSRIPFFSLLFYFF